jgi:hydroxymethylglutaryl-CoA synthase
MYNDFIANPSAPEYASIPADDAEKLLALTPAKSLTDKTLEKTFVALSKAHYKKHVEPSMECAQRCGNMYTASLYGGLASLLATVAPADMRGRRIAMFAFGSGCAASYWGVRVVGDTTEIQRKMDLLNRLASMKVVPCEEFVDALKVRVQFVRFCTPLT